jgi:hypothetical protein
METIHISETLSLAEALKTDEIFLSAKNEMHTEKMNTRVEELKRLFNITPYVYGK